MKSDMVLYAEFIIELSQTAFYKQFEVFFSELKDSMESFLLNIASKKPNVTDHMNKFKKDVYQYFLKLEHNDSRDERTRFFDRVFASSLNNDSKAILEDIRIKFCHFFDVMADISKTRDVGMYLKNIPNLIVEMERVSEQVHVAKHLYKQHSEVVLNYPENFEIIPFRIDGKEIELDSLENFLGQIVKMFDDICAHLEIADEERKKVYIVTFEIGSVYIECAIDKLVWIFTAALTGVLGNLIYAMIDGYIESKGFSIKKIPENVEGFIKSRCTGENVDLIKNKLLSISGELLSQIVSMHKFSDMGSPFSYSRYGKNRLKAPQTELLPAPKDDNEI